MVESSPRIDLGCRIQIGGAEYRVIHIFDDGATLCKLNTGKLELTYWSLVELFDKIEKQEADVYHDKENVVEEERLSDSGRKDYLYKKEIMQRIVEAYGPDFILLQGRRPSPVIDEIVKEGFLSRITIRRLIVRHLQSGLKSYSLLDGRGLRYNRGTPTYSKRTGRAVATGTGVPLTEEVLKHFDEAIREYKRHNNKDAVETIGTAYLRMIDEHYSGIR